MWGGGGGGQAGHTQLTLGNVTVIGGATWVAIIPVAVKMYMIPPITIISSIGPVNKSSIRNHWPSGSRYSNEQEATNSYWSSSNQKENGINPSPMDLPLRLSQYPIGSLVRNPMDAVVDLGSKSDSTSVNKMIGSPTTFIWTSRVIVGVDWFRPFKYYRHVLLASHCNHELSCVPLLPVASIESAADIFRLLDTFSHSRRRDYFSHASSYDNCLQVSEKQNSPHEIKSTAKCPSANTAMSSTSVLPTSGVICKDND